MRQILFIIMLIATNAVGQSFVVGSNSKAELKYDIVNKDTIYTISYENRKNDAIIDFKYFTFIGNDTKNFFYDNIKTLFLEENVENSYMDFELNGKPIVASTKVRYTSREPIVLLVISTVDGYFFLDERELKQLFGFNKN